MPRAHFFASPTKDDPWFRWRGASVLRSEAVADGVFALALAFLVTSIPVPNTYTELMLGLRQLPALAICFAMLWLLWYSHHLFFRRYALEDKVTVSLNAVFLFLVLAFVHPMRFLAMYLLHQFSGGALSPPTGAPYLSAGDGRWLMPFYSAGAAAVFGSLWWMHVHAWRQRERLCLDAIEQQLTRQALGSHVLNAGLALVSLTIALAVPSWTAVAGWIYAALGPLHAIHGSLAARRLAAVLAQHVPGELEREPSVAAQPSPPPA